MHHELSSVLNLRFFFVICHHEKAKQNKKKKKKEINKEATYCKTDKAAYDLLFSYTLSVRDCLQQRTHMITVLVNVYI